MSENVGSSLFEQIGGKHTLQKVHKIFYDKIYANRWIGQFFKHVDQGIIEDQQTDFMMQAMGGPAQYSGAFPVAAHKHMFITEDLFNLRQELMEDSLREANIPKSLIEKWMRIDEAFRKSIVKNSIAECERRFKSDEIVDYPAPYLLRRRA
jgi:hemoglobin